MTINERLAHVTPEDAFAYLDKFGPDARVSHKPVEQFFQAALGFKTGVIHHRTCGFIIGGKWYRLQIPEWTRLWSRHVAEKLRPTSDGYLPAGAVRECLERSLAISQNVRTIEQLFRGQI